MSDFFTALTLNCGLGKLVELFVSLRCTWAGDSLFGKCCSWLLLMSIVMSSRQTTRIWTKQERGKYVYIYASLIKSSNNNNTNINVWRLLLLAVFLQLLPKCRSESTWKKHWAYVVISYYKIQKKRLSFKTKGLHKWAFSYIIHSSLTWKLSFNPAYCPFYTTWSTLIEKKTKTNLTFLGKFR